MLWKQRGYTTTSGTKIKKSSFVLELLDANLLPGKLAIIKVEGHCRLQNEHAKGNQLAEAAPKQLSPQKGAVKNNILTLAFYTQKDLRTSMHDGYLLESESRAQSNDPKDERQYWQTQGSFLDAKKHL